jgi:hypothetical protein
MTKTVIKIEKSIDVHRPLDTSRRHSSIAYLIAG